jgi:hypothetical protein
MESLVVGRPVEMSEKCLLVRESCSYEFTTNRFLSDCRIQTAPEDLRHTCGATGSGCRLCKSLAGGKPVILRCSLPCPVSARSGYQNRIVLFTTTSISGQVPNETPYRQVLLKHRVD